MRNIVTIVGTGYVGLGYAAGFTKHGIKVYSIDLNPTIVELINKGRSPIDEPGMDNIIKNSVEKGLLVASTDLMEGFTNSDAVFICVGTYCDDFGNINLDQVKNASKSIGEALKNDNQYKVICVKSTVIPGTTDSVVKQILEDNSLKIVGKDFGLCMSPEFLREGNALEDITEPDKIVIGGIDQRSIDYLKYFFKDFQIKNQNPIIETDLRTAEMIKYVQNSFLALKISFINEMANLAEKFGVNISDVAKAIGLDSRISPRFLNAGAGFGGSCFPKDVQALLNAAKKVNYNAKILNATLEVNKTQKFRVIELLQQITSIEGKVIAILGLSFKPNTGDTREAVSISVINKLLELNVEKIKVYDPSSFAIKEIREVFHATKKIEYNESIGETLKDSNICLLLTEWDIFKRLTPQDFTQNMSEKPILIDGRRIYDQDLFEKAGIKIKILGQSKDKSFCP